MNYLEGFRRITAITSIMVALLTMVVFFILENSAQQEYTRLANEIREIKTQKELLAQNNTDFVKNYIATLKKGTFQDLKILEIEDHDQNKKYTLLWSQDGLPQESDIDSLIKNSFYLAGSDYEKETARKLLGYLAGFNDSKEIDSQLTRIKAKMYFIPILYGVGSFGFVWLIFYCIRYIALGFKKEKT
jgi:hypothetical protein